MELLFINFIIYFQMGKQKTKEKKKKSTIKWNFKLHIALTIIFFAAVGYLVYLARTNPKVFSAKGTGQESSFFHQEQARIARLLQAEKDQTFVKDYLDVLSDFFSVTRSLIFLIALTNSFDIFMPMLTFMETFMMLGLLTNNKHLLNDFYYNTFNSKLDVMNLIRMGFSPEKDPATLEILSRYNLSNLIFFNLSGEFILVLIVLCVSLIIKGLQICFKMEKLRYANTKLRPVWNGLVFYLLPRTLTFVGYQFRSLSGPTAPIIMNGILASLIFIALVVFFVMLVSQIKKINSRYEYLQDSRLDIGLARRYDYYRDFQLDCISFSIIYFPALNYFRLFFAFACLGAAPDFHYLQYGMIILTQSFFFLSHISTSSYFRLRDRLYYTFSEFAILLLIILVIVVGLTESVNHSEISLKIQTIIVPIMLALCLCYLLVVIADIVCIFFFDSDDRPQKSEIKIFKREKVKKSAKKIIWDESNKDETESDESIRKSNDIKIL